MKKKIIFSLTIFLILLFSNISGRNAEPSKQYFTFHVDIKNALDNVRIIRLSNIGKEIQYIPLETTPDCLIQEIDKIEISESYIFVSQIDKLLQFDRSGKFIRQIGSLGRGPGEYLAVPDFCIDEERQDINIISSGNLIVFGFDGHFKNSFKLFVRPSQIIIKDQNSLMYHLFNLPGSIENNPSWVITDKHGITLARIKNNLQRKNRPGLIISDTPLYLFNESIHFMEFGIDTLYSFQNGQKNPYAIFNFGNLKMDPDPLITSSNRREVNEKLKETLSINNIIENIDYLFISLYRGISNSQIKIIYNKKTKSTTTLKDNAFHNDIDGGLMFWPKKIMDDNVLIDYLDAYDFLKSIKDLQLEAKKSQDLKISSQLLNLSKQLTETSNPVLVILK